MKFINTDGMAFIGPGSEWFWTALSGIVLAVTFVAIYRQLSLQSSQRAIEQMKRLENEYASERMARHRLPIRVAIRDGAAPSTIPDGSATVLANYWEGVAALARAGHLDRSLLYRSDGTGCQVWWAILAPWISRIRATWAEPSLWEDFEWLAEFMAEMDRKKRATSRAYDHSFLAWLQDELIREDEELLRVEQALRTVIVASPDTLTVGQPLTTTPAVAEG